MHGDAMRLGNYDVQVYEREADEKTKLKLDQKVG